MSCLSLISADDPKPAFHGDDGVVAAHSLTVVDDESPRTMTSGDMILARHMVDAAGRDRNSLTLAQKLEAMQLEEGEGLKFGQEHRYRVDGSHLQSVVGMHQTLARL